MFNHNIIIARIQLVHVSSNCLRFSDRLRMKKVSDRSHRVEISFPVAFETCTVYEKTKFTQRRSVRQQRSHDCWSGWNNGGFYRFSRSRLKHTWFFIGRKKKKKKKRAMKITLKRFARTVAQMDFFIFLFLRASFGGLAPQISPR